MYALDLWLLPSEALKIRKYNFSINLWTSCLGTAASYLQELTNYATNLKKVHFAKLHLLLLDVSWCHNECSDTRHTSNSGKFPF